MRKLKRAGKQDGKSRLILFALLREGSATDERSATFCKDDIPKFAEAKDDGEDDAFPDEDAEHISGDLATVLTRVEELVGVKVLGRVRDVSESDV